MKGMDTYSLLPENEYTEAENRRYLVPTLGVTQTNDFIDNLRANQRTQNAQINQQTQNLGTKIPSVMGGLTGGTGYWTSRYQTPQTNMAAASLRAASQADALKTALANEKSYWQKKYQEAYRAQQKSAYDKSNNLGGGGGYDDGEEPDFVGTGELTGLTAEQDTNEYISTPTITNSTEIAMDSRSTERNKNIKVYKDSQGNVSALIVNGIPHYGREARAKYRYLKNAGLVR